jgi:quinol monooxygenase YgiN
LVKILFEVDARTPQKLHAKLVEQQSRRVKHGERAFSMSIDDNARHVCYVFLEWESLKSAQAFLSSQDSHAFVDEWPIEKVLGAIPLREFPSNPSEA